LSHDYTLQKPGEAYDDQMMMIVMKMMQTVMKLRLLPDDMKYLSVCCRSQTESGGSGKDRWHSLR